ARQARRVHVRRRDRRVRGGPGVPAGEVLLAGRDVVRGLRGRDRRDRDRRPADAPRRRARRRLLLHHARAALWCARVALAAPPRGGVRPGGVPAAGWARRQRATAQAEVRQMTVALELVDVGRRYGELRAVQSLTLEVESGSRHALIGPNGAGKSTLFGLISGTV